MKKEGETHTHTQTHREGQTGGRMIERNHLRRREKKLKMKRFLKKKKKEERKQRDAVQGEGDGLGL